MRPERGSSEASRLQAAWEAPRTGDEEKPVELRREPEQEFALDLGADETPIAVGPNYQERKREQERHNLHSVADTKPDFSGIHLGVRDYTKREQVKPEIHERPARPNKGPDKAKPAAQKRTA